MRCNVSLLAPTMLFLLTSYVLDLHAALALTSLGSISLPLPPGLERLPTGTLVDGILRISAARQYDGVSLFALAPEWDESFLKTSMAYSTM